MYMCKAHCEETAGIQLSFKYEVSCVYARKRQRDSGSTAD